MNLLELISRTRELDDDISEEGFQELNFTWEEIRNKVDAMVNLISTWEAEQKRLKELAQEFTKGAKVFENRKERLLDYLKTSMLFNESNILSGDKFKLKISKRTSYKYPDEIDDKYSDYIVVKKQWDKIKMKEDYRAGKLDIVEEYKKDFINIGVNK